MSLRWEETFFQKAEKQQVRIRDIFSDVFRRHTPEENARLFMAGTPFTTPGEASMLSQWIKPYMFARIFITGILLCVAAALLASRGIRTLSFLFILGSFLVPMVEMFFFWEMNVPRNIAFPTILLVFFVGGVLSLIFTAFLSQFMADGSLLFSALSIGMIEESGKILAVCIWLRKKEYRYILNGMLIGAAVGAGFAAIESVDYAMEQWSVYTLLLRAVLAPGGHVTWAAISGGALAWARDGQKLSVSHLRSPLFLKYFIFCVLSHGLWDYFCFAGVGYAGLLLLTVCIVFAGYRILKEGLGQVVEIGAAARNVIVNQAGWRLQGIKGAYANRRFAITEQVRIGRALENNLVFPKAPGVSRNHCVIWMREGRLYIADQKSTYGTYVNGNRLISGQSYPLKPDDYIWIGSGEQEFRIMGK